VFLEQGNDPALLFHGSFGFREVGQHVMAAPDGRRLRASMQMKELCSYEWVRRTYGGRLPEVPWLPAPRKPREPPHDQPQRQGGARA
jgi:uncharacterized protein